MKHKNNNKILKSKNSKCDAVKKIFILFAFIILFTGSAFSHGDDENQDLDSETSSASLQKIKLSKEQEKILGLRTANIELTDVKASIKVNGTIEEIPNLHFQINSPVKGRVTNINVSLGSQVVKGQTLAVLESQEVTQLSADGDRDQSNYRLQVVQAKANLDLEKRRYEREKSLYEHKINSQKDLEAAENGLKNAQASLKAAEQNLAISTNSIQKRLNQIGGSKNGQVYLKAPMSGEISEINMTLGQNVDLGQNLIHGVNLSQIWASGQVFEKDISEVKLGKKVEVLFNDSKKAMFGNIIFINPILDPEQKSFSVKVLLNNLDKKLRAGQFVQMTIETGDKVEKVFLLEKDSLVEKNGEQFVYVRNGEFLVPSKVKIGSHKHQDYLEIEDGLNAGDEIVIEGAYLLPSKGKIQNKDNQNHDQEPEKKEIPFLLWIFVFSLLLPAVFLLGKVSSKRKKDL